MQTQKPEEQYSVGKVNLEHADNDLLILRLGAPGEKPVVLTIERLTSLYEAIQQIKREKPGGLIIAGSAPEMFTTGIDIAMLDKYGEAAAARNIASDGQDLFAQIAALPCPTVALISGPCVGAGLELALACRYRLMSDHRNSYISSPEVQYGLIPAFGGTQRLPRLIGLPRALELVLTSRKVYAAEALQCGLVHEVLPVSKLLARGLAIAAQEKKARRRGLPLKDYLKTWSQFGRNLARNQVQNILPKDEKEYPAPSAALAVMLKGLESGVKTGYQAEAEEFSRLIETRASKALVRFGVLADKAKSISRPGQKYVKNVSALILGSGPSGAGLAGLLAKEECQVILKDTSEEHLNRALSAIRSYLAKQEDLNDAEKSFALNRIETTVQESPNTGGTNFVLEALEENLTIKQRMLSELAKALPPEAIIATTTSALSVTETGSTLENKERFIGMHFLSPVGKNALVELVPAKKTSDRTIIIAAALAARLGKVPVIVEDRPGFLINRILCPLLTEAVQMVEEGFREKDIDEAARSFGFQTGPLRMIDETGSDAVLEVSEALFKTHGDRLRVPPVLSTLVQRGRKGRKSGVGFYHFSQGEVLPASDSREVLNIKAAIVDNPKTEDIQDRLVLRMLNETVRAFDEGVAGLPGPEAGDQIDLGSTLGAGFPPIHGGVLSYADTLTAPVVLDKLNKLEERYGLRFTACDGVRLRAQLKLSFREKLPGDLHNGPKS